MNLKHENTYTDLWLDNFDRKAVTVYNDKFKTRWEKNIKHLQQVAFVRKYLRDEMLWCDCPIGSGRLMDELSAQHRVGFDISPAFLAYNHNRGITCVQGDLLALPFAGQFDLVTSLHTIFAFDEYREILRSYIRSLKPGGILIVDISNKNHFAQTKEIAPCALQGKAYGFPFGMNQQEIADFFAAEGCNLLESKPHDFWDSYYVLAWRHDPRRIARFFKKRIWSLINWLYFTFGLQRFLWRIEVDQPDERFTKYLVAARKR